RRGGSLRGRRRQPDLQQRPVGRLSGRLPPLPALRRDALDLLDVDGVVGVVAQVEAVDVPVGHADRADPLWRLRLTVLGLLVGVPGGRAILPSPSCPLMPQRSSSQKAARGYIQASTAMSPLTDSRNSRPVWSGPRS